MRGSRGCSPVDKANESGGKGEGARRRTGGKEAGELRYKQGRKRWIREGAGVGGPTFTIATGWRTLPANQYLVFTECCRERWEVHFDVLTGKKKNMFIYH